MEEEKHYFDNWDSMNSAFAENLTKNLKESEHKLSVSFVARDSWIKVVAENKKKLDRAGEFLNELMKLHNETGAGLDQRDFDQILSAFHRNCENELELLFSKRVKVSPKKRDIVPRNKTQLDYLENIREKDIVFGTGPAGTGKTYLAMAMAVSELLEGKFNRIILTRPAIEAGEKLGFLPGNLEEKILPYLRPLYDALYDMLEFEEAASLMEKNIIEVAPLAFMRGRTLNNAFIILDEAQNTTVEQMLMFLTRLGFSQCDHGRSFADRSAFRSGIRAFAFNQRFKKDSRNRHLQIFHQGCREAFSG
jgi:phosphate starvation-inducible PhoH-like protein